MTYILITVLTIIILLFANAFGYEIFYSARKKMTARFFQDRISDIDAWEKAVLKCCQKWLKKTPTVLVSDSKITLADLILNRHKRKSIQVWQIGSLYLALREYAHNNICLEKELDTIREKILQAYFQVKIYDSDYGLLAFAVCDSKAESNKMINYIIENQREDGIIRYKSNIRDTAFVDTLGFICPFLTKYGIANNEESFVMLAKKQYELYIRYGVEPNSKLPFHAVNCDSMIPGGICDWARGLAWFLIGIMDSYKYIKSSTGKGDSYYKSLIEKYAEILKKYQRKDGGYTWTLLSGHTTDSSATAVFGWYFACCANIFNDRSYLSYAIKCRTFLMNVTNKDGAIDYCQGDTIGIGVYSRNFGIMPFAEAFALRMQGEIKNAENK